MISQIYNKIPFFFRFTNGSSVLFSTSTIDWSSGLYTLVANVLVGGKRILTNKPLTARYILDLIVKYKINFLSSITAYLLQMTQLPDYGPETMKSIRFIFMTGAYCSEANLKRIRSALTMGFLCYGYGSTEFGGIAGNLTDYKPKSVGKITSNVSLKIIEPSTGERLGFNEVGEICASNGSRWLGYYNNPEATNNMIDSENFIHTGDLGYMDEENYLYITGRCKDIMKFKGFHYSPQTIEDIIMEHPEVLDVCVFGVFDEEKVDVPAAAVIKKEGSSLTAEELMDYVRSKTKAPENQIHYGVFFVKELARNNNGKLLRNKIKEICMEMEERASN